MEKFTDITGGKFFFDCLVGRRLKSDENFRHSNDGKRGLFLNVNSLLANVKERCLHKGHKTKLHAAIIHAYEFSKGNANARFLVKRKELAISWLEFKI